jgi:hypothetical protein
MNARSRHHPAGRLALTLLILTLVPSIAGAGPAHQAPSCAVGSWQASYPELEITFRSMMRPYTVHSLTGDVFYSIGEDGSFEVRYDQLAISLESDGGQLSSIEVDGSIRGALQGPEPDGIEGSISEMTTVFRFTVGETTQVMTIESMPGMRGPAPIQCGAGLLLIATVPFPDGNWIRMIFQRAPLTSRE